VSGKELYEEDVAKLPTYIDGTLRKTWDELRPIAREVWNKAAREKAESEAAREEATS